MHGEQQADRREQPESERPQKRRGWLKLLAPLALLLGVGAVWYFADLSALRSPEKFAGAVRSLREDPWAPVYVVLAFQVGALLFFPITALMIGTALAFDHVHGFVYAFVGTLLASASTYWIGRLLGPGVLDYVRGPKIERLQKALKTHAFRASIVARFMPVGNFTVINVLTGSLKVPFRAYLAGNVVGIFPGVLFFTLVASQLTEALWNANTTKVLAVVAGVIVAVALAYFLKRRSKSAREISDSLPPPSELTASKGDRARSRESLAE